MHVTAALPDPPSENSAGVMAQVDTMPPEWRALVHEYGLVIVSEIMAEADSVDEARAMLAYWRQQRQEAWLATNYVRRSMFSGLFKKAA